ncbi:MAG: SEC-C metal-binding domain-containing protein [Leptospirales bacterium]|nr:SEC-C metal-binding domain-containing protein [Leptospirales bacterium]
MGELSGQFTEEEFQSVKDSINLWIPEFQLSEEFASLSADEQKQADMAVIVFSQLMYVTFFMPPFRWDAEYSFKCVADVMPVKLTAGDDYWITVENSLKQFMKFCSARGYVPMGEEIAKRLEGITESLMAPAGDTEELQRMADDMIKKGLTNAGDESNPLRELIKLRGAEVKKMALQGKAGIISSASKPKRNDPCPCGSGKKYKKCCEV